MSLVEPVLFFVEDTGYSALGGALSLGVPGPCELTYVSWPDGLSSERTHC